jgi:hypothetical protein
VSNMLLCSDLQSPLIGSLRVSKGCVSGPALILSREGLLKQDAFRKVEIVEESQPVSPFCRLSGPQGAALGLITSLEQRIAIDNPYGSERLYDDGFYLCSIADWALSERPRTPACEQID